MIDPRLRKRTAAMPPRLNGAQAETNGDLVEIFCQTSKLSQSALANYSGVIRDFIHYMKTPEGDEIPAQDWSKEAIWSYLHFVESNYCAHFRTVSFRPHDVVCRQRVWIGPKPGADAAQQHCSACSLFKRPAIAHRVNALSKFCKFLARIGVIPYNFMADVVADYWEENPTRDATEERRRNPTLNEQVRLVNGTTHPQRRFFYAASAKWWFRPNEMFLLDRYASFGIERPNGSRVPPGFEDGFLKHPELAGFTDGGDLVYLPRKPGRPDKRKGNRWSVIDPELRPLTQQHFAWWDRTVKRDHEGHPTTTCLWLTERGTPLEQAQMYRSLFIKDCLRLGLMQPGDETDPLRTWTAHCQRHFGEKLLEMHNVPSDWCNHFRGDASKDARGAYFKPRPDQIRKKYLELVPQLGFSPFPQVPPADTPSRG